MANNNEKNPAQIKKFSAKTTFFEIMNSSFGIEKVLLNFEEYNDKAEKGNRVTKNIDVWIDFGKALTLCNDILSGKLAKLGKAERDRVDTEQTKPDNKGKTLYPQPIFNDMGGMNAEKAAAKRKDEKFISIHPYVAKFAEGVAISRQFRIAPGKSQPWVFSAEVFPGEESDKGIIKAKGYIPTEKVMVAMNDESLKEFALILKAHIEAYLSAMYTINFKQWYQNKPAQNPPAQQ